MAKRPSTGRKLTSIYSRGKSFWFTYQLSGDEPAARWNIKHRRFWKEAPEVRAELLFHGREELIHLVPRQLKAALGACALDDRPQRSHPHQTPSNPADLLVMARDLFPARHGVVERSPRPERVEWGRVVSPRATVKLPGNQVAKGTSPYYPVARRR